MTTGNRDVARNTTALRGDEAPCDSFAPRAGGTSVDVVKLGGATADIAPGGVYEKAPGHDAWVIGDAPFVAYEFESTSAATYAKPS